MNLADIDTVLATLEQYPYGWRAAVPESVGRFREQPIRIDFETRMVPANGEPPRPDDTELALARAILTDLSRVFVAAESKFAEYVSDSKTPVRVRDSHIWISREMIEDDGPERWSFVIGREGSKEFGYHIEFEGREAIDIWAGD